ncbi:MAG TPA: FAD-dependent oxidoreductase [Polyangiaceae bacterium]|nr:FAD-dependent oxidoreductase [Polyangiaceae bacterium]
MAKTPLLAYLQGLTDRALAGCSPSASPLSRRDFLACAVGATLVGCSPESEPPTVPVEARRIAIIGAGLAGLHCAYRLQQSSGGFDVTVYEANLRLGGRVFTGSGLFADKGLSCELGGEFIESEHATMLALADELGVALEDRAAARAGLADTYSVHGVEFSEDKLVAGLTSVAPTLLAALSAADDDDKAFRLLDNTTISRLLETHVPSDKYPELSLLLNVAFRAEFGMETGVLSSLNLWRLFPLDATQITHLTGNARHRLRAADGNRAFIDALLRSVRRVVSDQRLIRVARGSEGDFELTFVSQSLVGTVVHADQIVFALPFSTLRNVDLTGVSLSDTKRSAIANLAYGSSAKLVGTFRGAPWRDRYGKSGDLVSELPAHVAWDGSRGGNQSQSLLTTLLAGDSGARADRVDVEEAMAAALVNLDATLGTISDEYVDGSAVRMHWFSSPYSLGSSSAYLVMQFGSLYKTEGTPEKVDGTPERKMHFCGEHCSVDFKGSMEGAAETGALVAAEILKDFGVPLPPPLKPLVEMKALLLQPGFSASQSLELGIGARRAFVAQTHREFAGPLLRRVVRAG